MSQELKALQASEIGLANMVSYQSSGNTPNIHEYGQARRALDAVRAALTSAPKEQAEPQLLPEREGQPDVLTMSQPHELESGHWYSPAAVRKMLLATQPTPRAIADQQATMGQAEPSDAERLLDFALLLKRRPALKSAAREMLLDRDTSTQPERLGLCGGDAGEEGMRLADHYRHARHKGVSAPAREALRAHLSRMAVADAGAVSAKAQRLGAEAKEQAQVYASAWSLVGGRFDKGTAFADAETAERELNELIDRLVALAQHAAATAGEPKP